MKFFVNPAKAKKTKVGAVKRRKSSARKASAKGTAQSGARRTTRKKTRTVTNKGGSMAKAKRRATVRRRRRPVTATAPRKATTRRRRRSVTRHATAVVHHNPKRRSVRRRRYHHNPKLNVKGIGSTLVKGAMDAVVIVGGKAATNVVARLIPGSFGGVAGSLAKQVASALGVGLLGTKMLGRERGALLLAGGLTAPIESFIKNANVPIVSAALGDDMIGEAAMGAYLNGMGSYYVEPVQVAPALPAAGARGVGDYQDGAMNEYYGR